MPVSLAFGGLSEDADVGGLIYTLTFSFWYELSQMRFVKASEWTDADAGKRAEILDR